MTTIAAFENTFLIGFMGAGKTSVGTLLAAQLPAEFVDTDALVLAQSGDGTIAELFARAGEERFRDYEEQAVQTVCVGQRQVVATGGGVVLRDANIQTMRRSGIVVWLTASPEEIVARTQRQPQVRPLLNADTMDTDDPLTHVLRLLAERAPLYQKAAHRIVDTTNRSPEAVAREISRKLYG